MRTSSESVGVIVAVCTGSGGIPKFVVESALVGPLGLECDGHRFRLHGGAHRAVCLFSVEDYASLRRDGVACSPPGAFGENVLTQGLDFASLRPEDVLSLGDEVRLVIHDVREPCGTLKPIDARFPNLLLGRSGFLCRVLRGGTLRPGMEIEKRR